MKEHQSKEENTLEKRIELLKENWEGLFDKEFLTPEGFWNKDNDMYPFKIKEFISSLIKLK